MNHQDVLLTNSVPEWNRLRVFFYLFPLVLNRYLEDNANVSQVVYVDDSYSTSFYFLYPPQAKIVGEFWVNMPI